MLLLPYGDNNGLRRFPIMNLALIGANVAMFLYELQLGTVPTHWAVVPSDLTRHFGVEQFLDLLRSLFLHGGWLHLLSNMLFLYIFGDNVEDQLGSFKYLVFYLASGIAASMTQVLLTPYSSVPLIGASGAIAGVLGAYLILFPGSKVKALFWFIIILETVWIPAIVFLGAWFLIQFTRLYFESQGVVTADGIAYAAHVGGFIAGIVLLIF